MKTIPPKLTLPYKGKEAQGPTPRLLQISPTQEMLDSPPQEALPSNIPVSLLDTAPMFAVRPRKIYLQEPGLFANTLIEDVTLHPTLPLPVIVSVQEEKGQTGQHQVVANIASGAAITGGAEITSAALRYGTNIVMTHMLSLSVYGTFQAALAMVTVFSMIARVGMESAILRFLSIYRANDARGFVAGLIRFAMRTTVISSLLFTVLLFLSATPLAHIVYHTDAYVLPLKETAFLIPLVALQIVLATSLQALKALKWKVCVDRLISPVLILISLVFFYLFGLRFEAAVLAFGCGLLGSVIAGQFFLHRASRQIIRGAAHRFERKMWLRFALPMFLTSIVQTVLLSSDILLLAVMTTSALVGVYAAADRVGIIIDMPLLAMSMIFSPLIADYQVRGDYRQIANMFSIITKWSFSLGLPVTLCCCIFHNTILTIFSREYTMGGTTLIILSLGYLADTAAGPAFHLLLMIGRSRIIFINTTVTHILNFTLMFLLVPRFNIVGAAVSSAATVVISVGLSLTEVYCIMKIHPYRWDMFKPIVAGGIASGMILLVLHFVHLNAGLLAVLKALGLIILFMVIYIFALALLRLSKEDRILFNTVLAKLGRKKLVRA